MKKFVFTIICLVFVFVAKPSNNFAQAKQLIEQNSLATKSTKKNIEKKGKKKIKKNKKKGENKAKRKHRKAKKKIKREAREEVDNKGGDIWDVE